MHYAGPREALMHMIMRKNLGCSHFIIGRDHAGVGSFYGPYDAIDYVRQFDDLGIEPIFMREAFYCETCMEITNDQLCSHSESRKIHFSGTKIRQMFSENNPPSSILMRCEVYDHIMKM